MAIYWKFLGIVWAGALFGGYELSLEEKVGQVLMAHFYGETAGEEAKALIEGAHIGAIIYYNWTNGLTTPEQVKALSDGLQELAQQSGSAIPLLIAVDQEGGRVARLRSGFPLFPSNAFIAGNGDLAFAKENAFLMASLLRSVGINMNLAPVVDINSNPNNPVIGDRSFGSEPELVASFGYEVIQGFREAGVIATLKHFPGHGDVEIDSHLDLPVVNKSKEELEKCELLPFARLSPFVEAIMTAHLLVPAFDSENCSTLSQKTLQYLRGVIGFQGVIVSDSLWMQGVLKRCASIDESAILALNAGCDLLILGGSQLLSGGPGLEGSVAEVLRIHRSIVDAVKSGRIPEERLNEAVQRVLALKKQIQ